MGLPINHIGGADVVDGMEHLGVHQTTLSDLPSAKHYEEFVTHVRAELHIATYGSPASSV